MSRLTVYGSGLPSGGVQGQVLTMGASGAAWTTGGVAEPPMISGHWYSALSHGFLAGTTANLNPFTGTHLVPFYVPVLTTFQALQINIGTAGTTGVLVRLGWSTLNLSTGVPTVTADFGTVAGDSTGAKTATGSFSAQGLYWLVVSISGAGCGMWGVNGTTTTWMQESGKDSAFSFAPNNSTDYTAAPFPGTLAACAIPGHNWIPLVFAQTA